MSDPGQWTRWGPPPDPVPGVPNGRLAPAKVSRLIEIGIRILRRHWKPLVAASALFGGIGLILSELASAHLQEVLAPMITTDSLGAPEFAATDAQLQQLGGAALLSVAGTLVSAACLTIASLVAALYVDRDYRGGSLSFRAAVGHAASRAPVAIVAWLLTELALVGVILATAAIAIVAVTFLPAAADGSGGLGVLLAIIVGVAGVVVLITISVRWSVYTAVVALEPVGPVHALRRAWHLTAENTWRAFGLQLLVVLVVGLISTIVTEVIDAVGASGSGATGTVPLGLDVAVSLVLGVVTAAILPVMLAVLYFDLRVRRDRFELSLDPRS